MQQRRGKKILIYLFLLFLFGTVNNIELNNLEIDKPYIEITGLNEIEKKKILDNIQKLNLNNFFFINKNEIEKIINSNSLVEKFSIFKKYPDKLDIRIKQTKFLAKINDNGKEYFIGANGRLSKNISLEENLPYIFGKPEINEFLHFKKIIDQSKLSYDEIKNLYFFPSKRWDLELKNNIILKLSKKNTLDSIDNIFKILNDKNFSNVNVVDARIKDQIILND